MGKGGGIAGSGEDSGMCSHATQEAGVFVLNFALDDAVAKALVVCGGRDGEAQCGCGVERRVRHAEGAEDFALAEMVEEFVGETLESHAEEDESDVAVLGVRARVVSQRHRESGCEEFVASAGAQEKLLVSGQAGGMREQHAQGDLVATRVFAGEFSDDRDNRGVEVEQATFVKDHGRGCGGDHLCKGGEVEEGVGRRLGRVWVVGETTQGPQGDEFSLVGDGDARGGEGVSSDGVVQEAERAGEAEVLIIVLGDGERRGMGLEASQKGALTVLSGL